MIEREHIIAQEMVSDPAHLRRLLGGQVRRLLTQRNGYRASDPQIVRVVMPLNRVDPFVRRRA